MELHKPADHLESERCVIWKEVHELFVSGGKVNLGHGSPEDGIHEGILKALIEISSNPSGLGRYHQYTLLEGHPRLMKALGSFYSPLFGRQLDSSKEIMVTVGASFSIYCAITGLVNPGDEVIIVEPFYEQYPVVVEQARGKPVYVPFRQKTTESNTSDDWYLDPEELESKFSSKTKIIVINNPHNPVGKVFTRSELETIGNLAIKYNAVVLMDEVYEFLVFDCREHVRMASLPGMWERTITISSAGKLFSATGWRTGWCIGPHHLINCCLLVHQDSVRTCATCLQEALAIGLESEIPLMGKEDSYWKHLATKIQGRRDRIVRILSSVGMNPSIPSGTYFTIADFTKLASKVELTEPGDTKDFKFFRWLAYRKGLICLPMSAFYSDEHKHLGKNFVRFCFMKLDSTLDGAEKILTGIRKEYF